jgi:PAS domain S-box-containing protein
MPCVPAGEVFRGSGGLLLDPPMRRCVGYHQPVTTQFGNRSDLRQRASSVMSILPQFRLLLVRLNSSPLWFRSSSLLLLLLSAAMLVISLLPGIYLTHFSRILIPMLLVAILFSVFIFGLYFRFVWRKQCASNHASFAAVRKLASVFEHVLDAILILDDNGTCLEGNPAACDILRITRPTLLGQPFAQFYADPQEFVRNWKASLERGCQRGHAELRRHDGQKVYVDYSVAANYMPGQHILVLCNTTERLSAESSLRESEERFREIADNIQEIFWMMDAETKEVLFVTPAYEAVTGYSRAALFSNRMSYRDIIHPEDRERVIGKLNDAVATGRFDEEFRIVRADGVARWLWAKTSPKPDGQQSPHWFVGFALDVTARKLAESEAKQNLAAAEAAQAETEALRKATLALTQNLRMDTVLDTLLACLRDLVPYDQAAVILAEDDEHLFVGRQFPKAAPGESTVKLNATDTALLQRILVERKSVSVPDASEESDWREIKPLAGSRCWIGVPLTTANGLFGLLSIGASTPRKFTADHFRFAKSLAIPAAAAIYNARLYEYATIYSTELENNVRKLNETQKALEESQRRSSGSPHN